MQRTRPSPICWATSATIFIRSSSTCTSNSTASLSSGRAPEGNSTSTTGPAIATMRPSTPSLERALAPWPVSTVVISLLLASGRLGGRLEGLAVRPGPEGRARLAQSLGAADDLHDLGRDAVLASPVHHSP